MQSCEVRLCPLISHIHEHPVGDLSLDWLVDVAAIYRDSPLDGSREAETILRLPVALSGRPEHGPERGDQGQNQQPGHCVVERTQPPAVRQKPRHLLAHDCP